MFGRKNRKIVNIVAKKDGWILEKLARKLNEGLDYTVWTETPSKKFKIHYYINYAQVPKEKWGEVELALFTHIEEREEYRIKQWWDAAQRVEIAICMSKMYADIIKKRGYKTTLISPGLDFDEYKLKPVRIGVISKVRHTGRKGEDLIKEVQNIAGIEWYFTGGEGWSKNSQELSDEEVVDLYQKLDYVLIPSYYEGGPMSAIEALASGVEVIAPNVGWVPELPHISFKKGNAQDLRKVLQKIVSKRQQLRQSVSDRTWEKYVANHDKVFKRYF